MNKQIFCFWPFLSGVASTNQVSRLDPILSILFPLPPNHLACAVPLRRSFLILTIRIAPRQNLHIFVSATKTAGLTTGSPHISFSSLQILLSHITSDTFLPLFNLLAHARLHLFSTIIILHLLSLLHVTSPFKLDPSHTLTCFN